MMNNELNTREWFGIELRERMADAKIKAADLCKFCDVTRAAMSQYIYGHSFPDLWRLVLIAERLNCSVNDLLGYAEFDEEFARSASKTFPGENHFAEHLAIRIVRRMEQLGYDYESLANATGISLDTIDRYFGRWPELPRTDKFFKICEALDCTPSEPLGY